MPTQENLTFRGANIDFGDYISPDTRLIASNAAFAQKTANDRLDAIMKEREKIIDAIKLDKQYGKLTGQLTGQLNSLVEQAAQSQLSDNANFTKFNTGLISIQRDPVIQNALRSTEHAKAYADMRIKSPEIIDKDYLNNGMEKDWQRFKNGETDEFVLRPVYKAPDYQKKIFEGIKNLPIEEKEVFRRQGSAVFQEKTKGLNEQRAYEGANSIVNYLLTSDPETAPHFKRMMQFGYDPLPELQNTVKAAVDQYKNESVTLSGLQRSPEDVSAADWARIAIARDNADTAMLRAADGEDGGAGVRFEYLTGIGENEDKINIWKGTAKYNDGWKEDIVSKLKKSNSQKYKYITKDNIILEDVEKNTGKIRYKYKPGTKGVDVTQTYKVPSKGLQAIMSEETKDKTDLR